MKKIQLLSILILFISFFGVQSVVAQIEKNGKYYLIYDETNHKINAAAVNLKLATYDNLQYPNTGTLTVKSYIEKIWGVSADSKLFLYETVSGTESEKETKIEKGGKWNNETFSVNKNATKIRFEVDYHLTYYREIDDVILPMAPHTRLTQDGTINEIKLLSVPVNTQKTHKVKFYSFLTKSDGKLTAEIVNITGNKGNKTILELDKNVIAESNKLDKITDEEGHTYSFNLVYTPKSIEQINCSIKITNQGVGDPIYIPVTLSSSLAAPANFQCTENGYTFAKLSWNAVTSAEAYKLYDKNDLIGTYTTTSATITGLAYGSPHEYTVTSVVGSAESNKSNTIEVNCPAYPQVQNVQFADVQQNQVTVNWNSVTISPANHELVQYHVRLYQPNIGGTLIKKITQNETSCTFDGLIDQTQYTAYVDVEYKYTLNGETIHVRPDGNHWSSKSVITASFIPNEPFDGVERVQGEWYRIMSNSTKTLVESSNVISSATGTYTFPLNYPCENLKYEAWLSASADYSHTISDDATKKNKNLADEDYKIGNRYTLPTTSINTSTTQVVFTGNRVWNGNKGIYLDNIYAKIVPHIRLNKDNAPVSEITITCPDVYYDKANEGSSTTVDFYSFLTDPNDEDGISCSISGDDQNFTVTLPTTTKNDFCPIENTDKYVTIKFNPTKGDAHEKKYEATITLTSGSQTAATIKVSAKGLKHEHTLTWKNDFPDEILVKDIIATPAYISTNGCENKYTHPIKYSDTNSLFSQIEGYDYITANTEGKTTLKAEIEETDYCLGAEITRDIKVEEAGPAMFWNQNLIFVEKESTQEVILNATSNKEGNIIYEINGTDTDGIVEKIEGNKLYIKANAVGSVILKAYNDNYQDAVALNTLIVNSSSECNTTFTYNNTINVSMLSTKETTIELQYPAKNISFYADMGTNVNLIWPSQYTITVKGDEEIILPATVYYEDKTIIVSLKESVKKVTIVAEATWTSELKINNVNTTLHSSFDNYHITSAINNNTIDFGNFDISNARPKSETINLSHYSLPGGITFEIDADNQIFTLDKNWIETCAIANNNVTVTCNPSQRGTYTAYLVIKTGNEEKKRIKLQATVIGIAQSINWTQETLRTTDKDVIIAKTNCDLPVLLEIVDDKDNIVETTNAGLTIWVKNKGEFTIKASHPGSTTHEPISENKTFKSEIGTLRFDNNDGNGDNSWNNSANWLPINTLNTQRNVEPSAVVNAVISAEAVVSNAGQDEINNLTFENGGKLTVNPTSGLKANEVTNATADNLILKASADGNATFIYNSGTPSATVEMYSKATGGEKDGIPQWQYMGVAVDGATASNFQNAWLLKWTESENTTGDPWSDVPLAAGITLAPWAGYSISQPQATTYTTKGALMNGNHTYTLTRTESTDPDCGFNLLANSYTAPIDITKLTTNDFVNADACIILYNTGTYADWESQQGKSGETPAPGQLTVIPVNSAKAISLPTTIPSMQAFFVKANTTGATFTVNYDTDVAGATNHSNQMRAPRAENEFNVLKIMIEGENTRDRLYLLENEETSKAYDNGYEARKIFDAPRGHQMYATCEYGYASIDCSESFVGQTIGLKGDNEGEMLTISFDIDRLEGYESLYLYDKVTGRYVNIVAGEKYTFFGVKGADDNRFSIVTNPDDRNQTPPFVVIGEELAFDKSQINADNANIYIYDTSGRLLITDKVNPYENYNIPNMPKGIYLVSMNGYTTKIVKK